MTEKKGLVLEASSKGFTRSWLVSEGHGAVCCCPAAVAFRADAVWWYDSVESIDSDDPEGGSETSWGWL